MSERLSLSSADAAWLHMDRPSNLMVINSILLFEEPLDWERLGAVVQERLVERYPRFAQRVVEGGGGGGVVGLRGPHWERDPNFDLDRHLHRRGLAAPGEEAELQALVGDLASMPLDRRKPLWDMYFIDGPGEGSAVVVRMHHCIADGIALAQVMLGMTDSDPHGDAHHSPPPVSRHRGLLGTAVNAPLSIAGTVARESARTLTHPRHALELAGGALADGQALAKLVFTPPERPSALKRQLGAARAVAWSKPLALEEIKAIAHAHDATVNDVVLAAVSGALRGYLMARGEQPRELRALVPFNLRPLDEAVPRELGNRFGLVFLTLPLDRSRRRERLRECKRRMDEIKHSPEGPVSYAVLGAAGLTPQQVESRIIDFFTAKATAVMTNVPGPRETVYLAGVPMRTVLVWAPTSGSVGISVSIFSYHGEVTIGLLVHAHAVPDPQSILTRAERELAALGKMG